MTNAFEYGDALLPQSVNGGADDPQPRSPHIESNQPYLNLATYVLDWQVYHRQILILSRFRMVVLADEVLSPLTPIASSTDWPIHVFASLADAVHTDRGLWCARHSCQRQYPSVASYVSDRAACPTLARNGAFHPEDPERL